MQVFHRHQFRLDPSTRRPSTVSPKKGAQGARNSSKYCQNRTKRAGQATKEAHVVPSYVGQGGAAPRSTILHEAHYKYGSNFEALYNPLKKLLPDSEHTKSGTLGSSHPFLSQNAAQFSEDSSSFLTTTWKCRRIPNSLKPSFPPLRGSATEFSTPY